MLFVCVFFFPHVWNSTRFRSLFFLFLALQYQVLNFLKSFSPFPSLSMITIVFILNFLAILLLFLHNTAQSLSLLKLFANDPQLQQNLPDIPLTRGTSALFALPYFSFPNSLHNFINVTTIVQTLSPPDENGVRGWLAFNICFLPDSNARPRNFVWFDEKAPFPTLQGSPDEPNSVERCYSWVTMITEPNINTFLTLNFTFPNSPTNDVRIDRLTLDLVGLTTSTESLQSFIGNVMQNTAPTRYPVPYLNPKSISSTPTSIPTLTYSPWYPLSPLYRSMYLWTYQLESLDPNFSSCFQSSNISVGDTYQSIDLSILPSCISRYISISTFYKKKNSGDGWSGTVELDLINFIIVPLSQPASLLPGQNLFFIRDWVLDQPSLQYSHIQSVKLISLPLGSILTSQTGDPLTISDLSHSFLISVQMIFKPKFPTCSWSNSTCVQTLTSDSITDSITYTVTNDKGFSSPPTTQQFVIPTSQYTPTTLSNNVPATLSYPLTFPSFSTPQHPSFLDDYVIIIHTIPTLGSLNCMPLCFDESTSCPPQDVLLTNLPFVASSCSYIASDYSTNPSQVYDSFSWYLSHKTLQLGSSSLSLTNIYSQRVNKNFTITLSETEYWQQAAISTPLNLTISDPDWELVSALSLYTVTISSSNPKLRVYPSVELNQSGMFFCSYFDKLDLTCFRGFDTVFFTMTNSVSI